MVARRAHNPEVRGSSPLSATKIQITKQDNSSGLSLFFASIPPPQSALGIYTCICGTTTNRLTAHLIQHGTTSRITSKSGITGNICFSGTDASANYPPDSFNAGGNCFVGCSSGPSHRPIAGATMLFTSLSGQDTLKAHSRDTQGIPALHLCACTYRNVFLRTVAVPSYRAYATHLTQSYRYASLRTAAVPYCPASD